MDRLPTLAATLLPLLMAACEERGAPAGPVERVNAVQAAPIRIGSPEDFCDVVPGNDKARVFSYPELAGRAPSADKRWRWVNVWATWCKPCADEIPMLVKWQAELERQGTRFDLVLVSVDTDDATLSRFRQAHEGTPASLRIRDPDLAEAWVASLGIDKGAPLPLHVFVDPQGRIRCVRSGGVGGGDLAVIRKILAVR